MKTIRLNYKRAHQFVSKHPNARWDGWDIVLFTKDSQAYYSKRGVFDRTADSWGFERRITPTTTGQWFVNVAG